MRGRITRRTALGQIACAAAWAQSPGVQIPTQPVPQSGDNDPLRLLRISHPRLILLDADLDRIRLAMRENALAKRVFGDLEKECDRLLSVPPSEYKLAGTRLQMQTRRAVDRITTLALMYRLTGRDPWLPGGHGTERMRFFPRLEPDPLHRHGGDDARFRDRLRLALQCAFGRRARVDSRRLDREGPRSGSADLSAKGMVDPGAFQLERSLQQRDDNGRARGGRRCP